MQPFTIRTDTVILGDIAFHFFREDEVNERRKIDLNAAQRLTVCKIDLIACGHAKGTIRIIARARALLVRPLDPAHRPAPSTPATCPSHGDLVITVYHIVHHDPLRDLSSHAWSISFTIYRPRMVGFNSCFLRWPPTRTLA
jgi:hypothetical protein